MAAESRGWGLCWEKCIGQGVVPCRTHVLALQILLTNAKCAGDVTHLRWEDILKAESIDGADVEIEVSIILKKKKNANAFWQKNTKIIFDIFFLLILHFHYRCSTIKRRCLVKSAPLDYLHHCCKTWRNMGTWGGKVVSLPLPHQYWEFPNPFGKC